eukprot:EG_transcript_16499
MTADSNQFKARLLTIMFKLSNALANGGDEDQVHLKDELTELCKKILPDSTPRRSLRLLHLHRLFPEVTQLFECIPPAGKPDIRNTMKGYLTAMSYYNAVYTLALGLLGEVPNKQRHRHIAHQMVLLHQFICCCGTAMDPMRRDIEEHFAALRKAAGSSGELTPGLADWLTAFLTTITTKAPKYAMGSAVRLPCGRVLAHFMLKDINAIADPAPAPGQHSPTQHVGGTTSPTSPTSSISLNGASSSAFSAAGSRRASILQNEPTFTFSNSDGVPERREDRRPSSYSAASRASVDR